MNRTIFIFLNIIISISIANARIFNVPDECETIQIGILVSRSGDTVMVAPGEYVENLRIRTPVFLIGNPDDPASVIIDGCNGGDSGSVIYSNIEARGRLVITGFTICNGTGTLNEQGTFAGAYYGRDDFATIFDHCIIRDNSAFRFGIAYVGWWGWNEGEIRHAPRFRHCEFYRNESGGALIYYNGSLVIPEEEPLFEFCTFRENRGRGVISPVTCNPCVVDHCSFVDNDVSWVITNDNTRLLITNSISWGNERDGNMSYIYGGGVSDNFRLTISWSDIEGGEDALRGRYFVYEENNINAAPIFINPDNGDYHLSADSPCIDAGDPESLRDPDGTRADMGAYYYHQGPGLVVSSDSLHFGAVLIDSASELALTIINRGNAGLVISRFEIDEEAFAHNFAGDTIVQPAGEYILTVTFSPRNIQEYTTSLLITSNDPVDSVKTIRLSGIGVRHSAVGDEFIRHPSSVILYEPHPNPYNAFTTIVYRLSKPVPMRLALYDLEGRVVRRLVEGSRSAGFHRVVLTAGDLRSGLYFIRLEATEQMFTKKTVLIR